MDRSECDHVRLIQESVWLTLNQIADLQRDKSVISKHIKNIYESGELVAARTVAKFATVQNEGSRPVTREIEFYRLEVILAVGYRVKSDDVAPKVAADQGYQDARLNAPETARLEHDKALQRVMVSLLRDDTELYKQFVQNESFRRFVTGMVYTLTNA